jgi:hypothetical protein
MNVNTNPCQGREVERLLIVLLDGLCEVGDSADRLLTRAANRSLFVAVSSTPIH